MDGQTNRATYEGLRREAVEDNWDVVDEKVDAAFGNQHLQNALDDLMSPSDDVRDYAATVIMAATDGFEEQEQRFVRDWMLHDSYDIVRYRLGMALYRRGDRTDEVCRTLEQAKNDHDVGELATAVLKGP